MDQNNQHKQNSLNPHENLNLQSNENIPTAEPTVSEDKAPKKKSKKPLIIILLAVILAIGGYFGYKAITKDDDKSAPADKSTAKDVKTSSNKELKSKKTGEVTTIELYPDRTVSENDLEKFADTISDRAAILGDAYEVSADDSKITLTIAKEMLGKTASERVVTLEMLTSRGNIGFGLNEYVYGSIDMKKQISKADVVELDAKDILGKYTVNMSEERYNQIDALADNPLYALEISLKNDGEKEIDDLIESSYSDSVLTVMHDFTPNSYNDDMDFFGSALLKDSDDTSEMYIICHTPSYEKTAYLMKNILEEKEFDFGLVISIADEPLWQTEKSNFGENQVASLNGETIIAEYTPDEYTRSANTEADYAKYEVIIKSRLDILGIDYMFGTTGFDDKTYCIKLDPSDFAPDFFRLVFGDDRVIFRSSFDSIGSFYNPEVVEKDGKYVIRTKSSSTIEEILGSKNVPDNLVYLVANDVTVASADVSQMDVTEEGKYLYFENFLCFGDIEVSEEEKNVLELVCALEDDDYVYFDGTFRFRDGDTEDDNSMTLDDFNWKYNSFTNEDQRVFEIIADLGYGVQKMVDERNMLIVTIDLPVDDSLPENFLNAVKEIYASCDFDTGAYNEIRFVIKDETDESPADSFRIEVTKDSFDGKMVIDDTISGPKFNDYWTEVYELMEEDSFFAERSW